MHFDGFLSANFFVRKPEDEGKPKDDKAHFTVQYHVDSRENLQKYFDNHAPKMRQDGINRQS